MKKTGVWLDKNKALIVTLENNKESLKIIPSNVEHYHVYGGSGTRFKGGPQDVVQDRKYLEREKHQLKKYFENIISKIKNTDALVLFGPGEAQVKLQKKISDNYKELYEKLLANEKTDSMTYNQVKAWTRDFFSRDTTV